MSLVILQSNFANGARGGEAAVLPEWRATLVGLISEHVTSSIIGRNANPDKRP